MMEFGELRRILAAFEKEGVRYILVGSMAMAAQGLVRATRDVDFFVDPAPGNLDQLRRALKALFDQDPNVDQILAADLGGDYPAVQYTPPHGLYSMDILSRHGTAFRFEDLEAEEILVEGVRVQVASPRMLYRMKKNTVQPQDRVDAETIRERFGLEED